MSSNNFVYFAYLNDQYLSEEGDFFAEINFGVFSSVECAKKIIEEELKNSEVFPESYVIIQQMQLNKIYTEQNFSILEYLPFEVDGKLEWGIWYEIN